ncbi:hypothetical protein ACTXT7_013379, partial [Hymenolepis weldensis]
MLSVSLFSRFMMAFSRSFKEAKRFTILQSGKESVVSMDRIKPAYLDKLVTENVTSRFPSNPPVKETEKLMPVTRSGRH